jgi:hypothetical protein
MYASESKTHTTVVVEAAAKKKKKKFPGVAENKQPSLMV